MLLLSSVKNDITSLTHCKIKGHILTEAAVKNLYEDGTWIDTECARCHLPIRALIDPNDKNYYFISDSDWMPEGMQIPEDE